MGRHLLLACCLCGLAGLASGQQPPPPADVTRGDLRVTIVVGMGEHSKPRAASTYSLLVSTSRSSSLVMTAPISDSTDPKASRDVGVKIKCGAKATAGGGYALDLDLESFLPRTSVPNPPAAAVAAPQSVPHTVSIQALVALHDGQHVQIASGTDPLTSEPTWVEVSLAVLAN
jgi:hypothetical protein